jgi:chromate transporter
MAQEAVETYRWLSTAEMVDGLGLAETLPGPLIKITQFVGFLGAWRSPEPLSPLAAGVLGSALTTWVTFTPPMLLIFAGAPFVEQLRANPRLSGALQAVTAAVVGVILNLTVWFALHVLFADVKLLAIDWRAIGLAAVAAVLAFVFRRGVIQLVAIMAALGVLLRLLG